MRILVRLFGPALLVSVMLHAANIPVVGIYLAFDSLPSAEAVEAMKVATESLLKPAGIALEWRASAQNTGTEPFSGLAVLRFKGICRPIAPPASPVAPPFGETDTLARTQTAGGHILPFTDVQCDEVRKALAYLRQGAGQAERQAALGRALGRVVAHELFHILANTASHTAEGLAKASQLLPDLVSTRELNFDPLAIDEIKTRSANPN